MYTLQMLKADVLRFFTTTHFRKHGLKKFGCFSPLEFDFGKLLTHTLLPPIVLVGRVHTGCDSRKTKRCT
jgi:hypothetical protein